MKNYFIITFLILVFGSCKKEIDQSANSIRKSVIQDYTENYLGSSVNDIGWTGDIISCKAGSISKSTDDKVIRRINYFRRLVGLNDNTTLDNSKSYLYQNAALMMSSNGSLSHTPPNTWKCWTQDGYFGASTSNLALGVHSSDAITLFINDPGSGNVDVGHRRWILHSLKSKFSYGSTRNSMSLGVIGMEDKNEKIPSYIAYPPKGYIPSTLVFPRWSFSKPGADFSKATVTMTGPEGNVPLTIISRKAGYGDKTIVWEPQNISIPISDQDIIYKVVINDIMNATQSSFDYDVIIIHVQ